jgi:hypothetical protein
MLFNPRWTFIIDVAGIAIIVLSMAVIAYILFSIWPIEQG